MSTIAPPAPQLHGALPEWRFSSSTGKATTGWLPFCQRRSQPPDRQARTAFHRQVCREERSHHGGDRSDGSEDRLQERDGQA